MSRAALALLVCALAGALAATAAAAGSGAVYAIGDCIHPSQRPESIVVACGDGNYALSGLRYTSWGGPVARAAGFANANDCRPSCAGGRFHRWRVRIQLSSPRRCRGYPGRRVPTRRYYDTLTVSAVGAHPAGTRARMVVPHLTCP